MLRSRHPEDVIDIRLESDEHAKLSDTNPLTQSLRSINPKSPKTNRLSLAIPKLSRLIKPRESFETSVDIAREIIINHNDKSFTKWPPNQLCWLPKGPLLAESKELLPKLRAHGNQSCEAWGREARIELFMVGTSTQNAQPLIVVSSLDPKVRRTAKKAIKGLVKDPFRIGDMKHPPSGAVQPVAMEDGTTNLPSSSTASREVFFDPSEVIRPMGIPILIRHGLYSVRRATANLVYDGNRFGCITAAHALDDKEPDDQFSEDEDEMDVPFYEESESDTESHLSDQSSPVSSISLPACLTERTTTRIINGSYATARESLHESTTPRTVPLSDSAGSSTERFLSGYYETLGEVSVVLSSVDCVVVVITNSKIISILQGYKDRLEEFEVQTAEEIAGDSEAIAWTSHGPLYGSLLEAPSLTRFAQSTSYEWVYKFVYQDDVEIRMGDCGTLVTDVEGRGLYGHVVAVSQNARIAHVVAAKGPGTDLESGIIPALESNGHWKPLRQKNMREDMSFRLPHGLYQQLQMPTAADLNAPETIPSAPERPDRATPTRQLVNQPPNLMSSDSSFPEGVPIPWVSDASIISGVIDEESIYREYDLTRPVMLRSRTEGIEEWAWSQSVGTGTAEYAHGTPRVDASDKVFIPEETASWIDTEISLSEYSSDSSNKISLEDGGLNSATERDGRTEAFYKKKKVWIEWKDAEPISPGYASLDSATEQRVNFLATQLKNRVDGYKDSGAPQLRIPTCFGYVKDRENMRFGIVFGAPSQVDDVDGPQSLSSLLGKDDGIAPSSATRFRIMYLLAETLQGVHATGLLHRAIRPSNILFFNSPGSNHVNLDDPYLSGFDYTRPLSSLGPSNHLSGFNYTRPSSFLCPSNHLSGDHYRQPDVQGHKSDFSQMHDIYALGLVLLETALWQPVEKILVFDPRTVSGREMQEIRESLLKDLKWRQRVRSQMGGAAADVIWSCLAGQRVFQMREVVEYDEGKELEAAPQRVLGVEVVDRLKQILNQNTGIRAKHLPFILRKKAE